MNDSVEALSSSALTSTNELSGATLKLDTS